MKNHRYFVKNALFYQLKINVSHQLFSEIARLIFFMPGFIPPPTPPHQPSTSQTTLNSSVGTVNSALASLRCVLELCTEPIPPTNLPALSDVSQTGYP